MIHTFEFVDRSVPFIPHPLWAHVSVHSCWAFGLWFKWEPRRSTGTTTVFLEDMEGETTASAETSTQALIIGLPFARIDICFPRTEL